MTKNILIYSTTGLGNKIFDAIIGLYLKQTYGWNIVYSLTEDPHDLSADDISIIFPKLANKFEFVNREEGKKLYADVYKNLELSPNVNLNDIEKYFNGDNLRLKTFSLYDKIFELFEIIDQTLFDINTNLIDSDLIDLTKKNYGAIHIRYGDKLHYAFFKGKMDIRWPIFSPYFYFRQIQEIKKMGLKVLIFSDSPSVVKEFILKKYDLLDDTNIFLMNISPIKSIYLLSHAQYFVLSHSTFSYIAYLFGKKIGKNKKIVIADFHEKDKYLINDTQHSKNWTIWYGKQFILNFDVNLVKQMQLKLKID